MSQNNIVELFLPNAFPSRLTPAYIRFALLLNGTDLSQRDKSEPLRYLELEKGEGQRINIHAAALSGWECWRIDESRQDTPTANHPPIRNYRMERGQEVLAKQGRASDLPRFDIIVINSAMSLSSEPERQSLFSIIKTNLKTGGLVCIGYSTMPACVSLVPVRHLMRQQMSAAKTDEERRVQALQALDFADNYSKTEIGFFANVPTARNWIEHIRKTPYEHLEKTWLDPDWRPFYFVEMAAKMEDMGCQFVTSLNLASQLDMCQPGNVAQLLQKENDPQMRETIRDYGMNQLTRLDVFALEAPRPSAAQIDMQLADMAFCLTGPVDSMGMVRLPTPSGDVVLEDKTYPLLLQALAGENYRPKTMAELQNHPMLNEVDSKLFVGLINILVAAGMAFPVHSAIEDDTAKACARLNRLYCEKSRDGKLQPALASPVLGTGISLSRIAQLLLLAWTDGATEPASCAKAVWDMFARNNESLYDQNHNPMNEATALSALEPNARLFLEETLPYLQAIRALPAPQLKASI